MATLVSAQAAAGIQPVVPVGNVEACAYGEYNLAAALAAADVIQMVKVPAGAIITNVMLAPDDLDTGTALTLSVGDGTTAARFISASTAGQTGAVVALSVAAGIGYQYTVDDTIDVTVAAGPSTSTTGKVRLVVKYKMSVP